ncbi:hypothetical protein GF362_06260 [Candidatus Dojkabacteria bacterium]|nr:hypothetical protein [Candidatus Dojkabacteria bacterium]
MENEPQPLDEYTISGGDIRIGLEHANADYQTPCLSNDIQIEGLDTLEIDNDNPGWAYLMTNPDLDGSEGDSKSALYLFHTDDGYRIGIDFGETSIEDWETEYDEEDIDQWYISNDDDFSVEEIRVVLSDRTWIYKDQDSDNLLESFDIDLGSDGRVDGFGYFFPSSIYSEGFYFYENDNGPYIYLDQDGNLVNFSEAQVWYEGDEESVYVNINGQNSRFEDIDSNGIIGSDEYVEGGGLQNLPFSVDLRALDDGIVRLFIENEQGNLEKEIIYDNTGFSLESRSYEDTPNSTYMGGGLLLGALAVILANKMRDTETNKSEYENVEVVEEEEKPDEVDESQQDEKIESITSLDAQSE